MKNTLNELFWDNPMKVEIMRALRKFGTLNRNNSTNVVMVALVAVIYLIIVASNFVFRAVVPAFVPLYLALILVTLTGPIGNYQSIAGEREKRTWELLVVSPVTKAQIVIGKWMGAILLCLLWVVLSWLPVLVLSIPDPAGSYSGREEMNVGLVDFLQAQAILITFALFTTSLTIFFSARSQRSLNALGLSLTILFVILILVPVVASALSLTPDSGVRDVITISNPFMMIWSVVGPFGHSRFEISWAVCLHCGVYLALALGLMFLAISGLNRADNESAPPSRETHA